MCHRGVSNTAPAKTTGPLQKVPKIHSFLQPQNMVITTVIIWWQLSFSKSRNSIPKVVRHKSTRVGNTYSSSLRKPLVYQLGKAIIYFWSCTVQLQVHAFTDSTAGIK